MGNTKAETTVSRRHLLETLHYLHYTLTPNYYKP